MVDGFAAKYETYGAMLYRIAYVYTGSKADAEEAVQETFVRLLYKAPVFRDGEHEKAWLIRVVTNVCKNMLTGWWRRRRAASWEELHDVCVTAEERRTVDSVTALPLRYRAVIHLHYYEGYSVKEMAEIVGASESAVKMRLQRGRRMLKTELEGD